MSHTLPVPGSHSGLTKKIFLLALPLILSNSGYVIMQFMDGMFLSWYSPSAVAAVGASGLASWLLISVFIGTAGYASAFAAQYMGAGQKEKIGPVVWQSTYFSIAAAIPVTVVAFFAEPLFRAAGHGADLVPLEAEYFRIVCLGSSAALLGNAFSTFFTGRGDTRTLMGVQLGGLVINGVLDYLMIFGYWGFPRMGIGGAALATVMSQIAVAVVLGVLIIGNRTYRRDFNTWRGRSFDPAMMKRLISFGLPSGFRFSIEALAWTSFLFFIGRIGTVELAASTIAFRFNGFAFFPIIGLSQAVGILVGQAQGRGDPGLSVKITWRGMGLAELWMVACAAVFVLTPRYLYGLFAQESSAMAGQYEVVSSLGIVLMRFVAVYCSLDACNIILVAALQYAGDTRWTFVASVLLHGIFIAGLLVADRMQAGLIAEWTIATAFVMCLALVWVVRFYVGSWKKIRLVTPEAVAVPT